MKKLKKIISMPAATVTAFLLAAVLLLFTGIGGTRAALTYYSQTYATRVSMSNIGVTLNENGEAVSYRNYSGDDKWNQKTGTLLSKMLGEGEKVKLGVRYPEELSVTNTGDISQYVRVSIYKYWMDEKGNKCREVSPDMIGLHLINQDSAWIEDKEASTKERTVLYYNRALEPGKSTPLLSDSLVIDEKVAKKVTQTEEKKKDGSKLITTVYDYNGYQFYLEAKVDAVQEHNAEDAIWSAWGRAVSVNNGTLSLK